MEKEKSFFAKPFSKKDSEAGVREKFSPITVFMLVVLIIYSAILLGLLAWALMTSFKDYYDFRLNKIGLPEEWVWNYSKVFNQFYVRISTSTGQEKVYMGQMFVNAFLYSIGCAFCHTLVPCITAYACARFNFKFSQVIYTTVIITMVLPIVGSLPAEIQMAKSLGLFNQIWGLWIMKANFLGLYFLVFYGNFKAMPMAYTEAAQIDGASNFKVMTKIILPLQKNTFFTIMLIGFISYWNDYQIPLVYLPSYPTIAQGMYEMASTTLNEMARVPMRMTAAMLMLIPILVLFLIFNKRLMGNLTVGGIKG